MTQKNNDRKYWVALATSEKLGARSFTKLLKTFGDLKEVWRSQPGDLMAAGLTPVQIEAVLGVVKSVDLDEEIEKLARLNIDILILTDEHYPKLLKEIADPPGVLYLKGEILPTDEVALGVVGSRKYTSYGERATQFLVEPLARNQITIVSGLALGIDTLAHQAALDANGRTIGVLGCGLDQIYPSSNVRLADKIIQGHGAIISEYPPGTPAYRSNFPLRNRIIAGLTLGTVVIEGAIDSGSLITAQAAIEYNREVFAVPGSIFSDSSAGTNKLIQMGAKLVTEAKDILTELALTDNLATSAVREIVADSPQEEILLKLLKTPRLVDEIIKESGLTSSEVNSSLIILEMKGMISNLGGTRYVIKGRLKE